MNRNVPYNDGRFKGGTLEFSKCDPVTTGNLANIKNNINHLIKNNLCTIDGACEESFALEQNDSQIFCSDSMLLFKFMNNWRVMPQSWDCINIVTNQVMDIKSKSTYMQKLDKNTGKFVKHTSLEEWSMKCDEKYNMAQTGKPITVAGFTAKQRYLQDKLKHGQALVYELLFDKQVETPELQAVKLYHLYNTDRKGDMCQKRVLYSSGTCTHRRTLKRKHGK
jgi:hypothetical protein